MRKVIVGVVGVGTLVGIAVTTPRSQAYTAADYQADLTHQVLQELLVEVRAIRLLLVQQAEPMSGPPTGPEEQ